MAGRGTDEAVIAKKQQIGHHRKCVTSNASSTGHWRYFFDHSWTLGRLIDTIETLLHVLLKGQWPSAMLIRSSLSSRASVEGKLVVKSHGLSSIIALVKKREAFVVEVESRTLPRRMYLVRAVSSMTAIFVTQVEVGTAGRRSPPAVAVFCVGHH